MLGELPGKFGESARVLEFERNAAWTAPVSLRHRSRTFAFELRGEIARALVKLIRVPALAARSRTGQHQRAHASGIVERDLENGVTTHRQANQMRLLNFKMVEYRNGVAHDMLVTVDVRINRYIGRFVSACGIDDAAMALAKFAQLRLPAAMVAGELVHEQYRRALSNFFVMELNFVWRYRVRHCKSTLLLSFNIHRDRHQFRDVASSDPLHHSGTMILHGLWADLEL